MILLALLTGCTEMLAEGPNVDAALREAVLNESAVCMTVDWGTREVLAIGIDTGDRAVLGEVPRVVRPGNDSLARLGADLIWCGRDEIVRYDLTTGTLDTIPGSCSEITDIDGELMLQRQVGLSSLEQYGSWEDLRNGTGRTLEGRITHFSRLGRIDGQPLASWHAGDSINVYDSDLQGIVLPLEGWDAWVLGISGTDGRLFIVDDGRRGNEWGPTRLAEYDLDGFLVQDTWLDQDQMVMGLTCSGPLDPETYVDLNPPVDTGPSIGL